MQKLASSIREDLMTIAESAAPIDRLVEIEALVESAEARRA
jgi:hypothetical protein